MCVTQKNKLEVDVQGREKKPLLVYCQPLMVINHSFNPQQTLQTLETPGQLRKSQSFQLHVAETEVYIYADFSVLIYRVFGSSEVICLCVQTWHLLHSTAG